MTEIRVFERGTDEYRSLDKLAMCLTLKSPNGYRYYVGRTYYDYGQSWEWTTVLCDAGEKGVYQALNPREQGMIIMSDGLFDSVCCIADEVLRDKFCPDR